MCVPHRAQASQRLLGERPVGKHAARVQYPVQRRACSRIKVR